MDIKVFSESELPLALAALRSVCDSPRGRQLREVLAEIHGVALAVDPAAALAEVSAAIVRPHARLRLVQLAIVAALVDGMPTRPKVRAAHELAEALAVREPGLAVLRQLAAGRRRVARFLVFRRIAARVFGDAWRRGGVAGLRRLIAPLWLGGGSDPALAWRFRQLGLLPEGTLGHTLWAHCTERQFAFPGERKGIPEQMVFHDIGHLLTGFSTEAPGEIQQGAFQAGFVRRDGFMFLLFAILQFHLGIKVTPVAPGAVGLFDVPLVMRALARGAATRDLSEDWSLWSDCARPLSELRAAYGVPPD